MDADTIKNLFTTVQKGGVIRNPIDENFKKYAYLCSFDMAPIIQGDFLAIAYTDGSVKWIPVAGMSFVQLFVHPEDFEYSRNQLFGDKALQPE